MAENKPMRCMVEMKWSTDDHGIPIRISYPSVLTHAELSDLKDMVAIWLRQLERHAVNSFADIYQPPLADTSQREPTLGKD